MGETTVLLGPFHRKVGFVDPTYFSSCRDAREVCLSTGLSHPGQAGGKKEKKKERGRKKKEQIEIMLGKMKQLFQSKGWPSHNSHIFHLCFKDEPPYVKGLSCHLFPNICF